MWVGESHQPLYIPANSAKEVIGKTDKITKHLACMVTPNKSKHVLVLLMNTNSYNIWIQHPLLAVNVVEAGHCSLDYQSCLSHDGNEVKIACHPISTQEVQEEILSQSVSQESSKGSKDQSGTKEGSKKSKFGPQPDFNNPNFDFHKELKRLPFPLNLGEVEMSRAQQVRFLELIYDNQVVF